MQPCDEMSIGNNLYKTYPKGKGKHKDEHGNDHHKFQIEVNYPEDTYYEISTSQAFGFESFWAGVGGFVGIFLGFSLLQLPELVTAAIKLICTRIRCMSSSNTPT